MISVGKVIKKWRKKEGLTQEQLAEWLRVSLRAVSYWEEDSKYPRQNIVIDRLQGLIPELRGRKELRNGRVRLRESEEGILVESLTTFTDNFPVEIGVKFWNKEFRSCVEEFFSRAKTKIIDKRMLEEYKKRLVGLLEDSYLTIKDTMGRAVEKDPLEPRDEDFLKEYFKPEFYFSWRKNKEKKKYIPEVSFSLNLTSLLVSWTFYVWRGEIKVRRCKREKCPNIFLLTRRDKRYCCPNCRLREWRKENEKERKRTNYNETS